MHNGQCLCFKSVSKQLSASALNHWNHTPTAIQKRCASCGCRAAHCGMDSAVTIANACRRNTQCLQKEEDECGAAGDGHGEKTKKCAPVLLPVQAEAVAFFVSCALVLEQAWRWAWLTLLWAASSSRNAAEYVSAKQKEAMGATFSLWKLVGCASSKEGESASLARLRQASCQHANGEQGYGSASTLLQ